MPRYTLCAHSALFLMLIVYAAAHDDNIHFIDAATGASCLDGTPYAINVVPADPPSNASWTLSFEGGGWCYGAEDCTQRAGTHLGSSSLFPRYSTGFGGCMRFDPSTGEPRAGCNVVHFPYCDGASFSGHREQPLHNLTFRGKRNLDAALDLLFGSFGLASATDVLVTGSSAGGLATFLHTDHVRDRVISHAPQSKVVAVPVVGYFLDTGPTSDWAKSLQSLVDVHNVTTESGLNQACVADRPKDRAWECFLATHMQRYISTPFFMLNSRFDQWQLDNIAQVPCFQRGATQDCNSTEQQRVTEYGVQFLTELAPVLARPEAGVFITTCVCHGCPWSDIVVQGKSAYQALGAWQTGWGGEHKTVDGLRGPNGNGAMNNSTQMRTPEDGLYKCNAWPVSPMTS